MEWVFGIAIVVAILVVMAICSNLDSENKRNAIIAEFNRVKTFEILEGGFISDYEFQHGAMIAVSTRLNKLLCVINGEAKLKDFNHLSHIDIKPIMVNNNRLHLTEIRLFFIDGTYSIHRFRDAQYEVFKLYSLIEKNLGKDPFDKSTIEQSPTNILQ